MASRGELEMVPSGIFSTYISNGAVSGLESIWIIFTGLEAAVPALSALIKRG